MPWHGSYKGITDSIWNSSKHKLICERAHTCIETWRENTHTHTATLANVRVRAICASNTFNYNANGSVYQAVVGGWQRVPCIWKTQWNWIFSRPKFLRCLNSEIVVFVFLYLRGHFLAFSLISIKRNICMKKPSRMDVLHMNGNYQIICKCTDDAKLSIFLDRFAWYVELYVFFQFWVWLISRQQWRAAQTSRCFRLFAR